MNLKPKQTLNSLADIKQYFAENSTPYYFISASNFNLMGMHEWVRDWQNINLVDCFDGSHPHVLMVENDAEKIFENIEEINQYLISNEKVLELFTEQQAQGRRGRVVFLFFNEQLEATCQSLNLDVILPKSSLVREIDSKITTTELANQVGVHSVPNVLTKISSYADLQRVALEAGLGEKWVVQTAYGDSGKTTFFIACEADYQAVARKIEIENIVKVMRWINCTGTAIEACATRWGTFVGPLLSELIGIESLTPYPGGWCGNELYQEAFSSDIRRQVQQKTQALGDALYQRGYRGYFELDYLIDLENKEVYLGELNARITGISAMTNMSDFCAKHIPLFLFHLLEYETGIDLTLDVNAFNQAMLREGAAGKAAQMILKYTDDTLKIITDAPVSGVYKLDSQNQLILDQAGCNRRDALAEDEAYILRIMSSGEYAYKGGDMAIMFLNLPIRTEQGKLNATGECWLNALKQCFQFRQLNQEERSSVELTHNPANVKSGRES